MMNQEPPALGEYNEHEIYPMPAFATIRVADVAGVAAWYERALGFATVFKGPEIGGQPVFVHLRRHKYQDLLITPAQTGAPAAEAPASLTLSFSAEGEVDELAARARGAEPLGLARVTGPVDTPWNTRDLRVTDPAGHQLVFTGRNPNADPAQLGRMKAMLDAGRKG
jgi:catechol 2,3-dioxygenase-like lactoylglutathione lyase family enzyme